MRRVVVRTREEAERRLAEVRNGRELAEVAAEVNTDGTKMHRGAIGWIRRGMMVRAFEEAAFELAVGEVSGPVKTEFGWHLIRVEKKRGGDVPPFESVRWKVRKRLELGAVQEIMGAARATLGVRTTEALEGWIARGHGEVSAR